MSGPEAGLDEFGEIAALFEPLTLGAPGAFGLLDDAAVIPQRPGFDLVVTKDAIVEGVHAPAGAPPDLMARKLLRANLSDLAAKAAVPDGYFLAVAWPRSYGLAERSAFARGLQEDGEAFGVPLLGGDTVRTPGPLTASVTMSGWVPVGGMVRRTGASPGDLVLVSGPIGDGVLGLHAVQGGLDDPEGYLAGRYWLPRPRLDVREALRAHATASADVSDGLIADAGHVARASGVAMSLDLDRMPLSEPAALWLAAQADRAAGLLTLASGGDDYEVVCTASPAAAAALGWAVIGQVTAGRGVSVSAAGRAVDPGAGGWRHA